MASHLWPVHDVLSSIAFWPSWTYSTGYLKTYQKKAVAPKTPLRQQYFIFRQWRKGTRVSDKIIEGLMLRKDMVSQADDSYEEDSVYLVSSSSSYPGGNHTFTSRSGSKKVGFQRPRGFIKVPAPTPTSKDATSSAWKLASNKYSGARDNSGFIGTQSSYTASKGERGDFLFELLCNWLHRE